jgi:hypothetical protein
MCTDDVRCPELKCGIKFDYATIKHILLSNEDKVLFERYDRFVNHRRLEQIDEFIWCSNPKCRKGQLNNIVTCIYWHKKTCFKHKTQWDEGLTCREYDSIINGDTNASLQ